MTQACFAQSPGIFATGLGALGLLGGAGSGKLKQPPDLIYHLR